MTDKQRNPKLDLEINTPVTLTIGKNFWQGNNEYGKSFGYNVTYEGSEYTFFASEFVHDRFQSFGQGTTVRINKRQRAGEKSVIWEIGEVNGHASAKNTDAGPVRPKYEPATFNREAYRTQRVQRMVEAYLDAGRVREMTGDDLSSEDLRSIAISFVIEENRDRVPLSPVERPPDSHIPELLEAIKKTLTDYVPGESETEKASKADFLEKAFSTRKWQEVTQLNAEQLAEGHAKLQAAIQAEQDEIPF